MKKTKNENLAEELGLKDTLPSKKPRRKSSEPEHNLQCACVRWFRLRYRDMKHNLFAVPNGGWRNNIVAAKLKKEGVLSGVSDLILLKRNTQYGALLIEMKSRTGSQSEHQKEWETKITEDGYKYVICRSLDEFKSEIESYLKE